MGNLMHRTNAAYVAWLCCSLLCCWPPHVANAQSLSTELVYAQINGQLYQVNLSTGAASLVGAIGGSSPVVSIAIAPTPDTIYGLTNAGNLVSFRALAPGRIETSVAITGLQPSEAIVGMDFRPSVFPAATLYAVGSTSRLYTINLTTGVATQVGSSQFSTLLNGTRFGVNFNPRANANNNLLRIVSDGGQNIRVNPDTGVIAGVDTAINPGSPQVVGAAYTENFSGANTTPNPTPPPATNTTSQYVIDAATNTLMTQGGVNGQVGGGPNGGVLTTIGPLGVTVSGRASLDVSNRFVFANGFVAQPYNHRVFVVQGSGSYTYAVTGGTLPDSLTFSSTGVLSGTPSAIGTFSFDVTATGTGGPFTRSYSVTILSQLTQSITFPQPATPAVQLSFTVSASGGASGNQVTFASLTPTTCSASGTNGATISALAAGTCTIAANQVGNANFSAAPQVTRDVQIPPRINVVKTGNGSGSAVGTQGATINCGGSCAALVVAGSSVTLSVFADPFNKLAGVTGVTCPTVLTNGQCSFTMPASDVLVNANFRLTANLDGVNTPIEYDAATDGVILVRYLLGHRGSALIAGIASQQIPTAIEAYLAARVAANDFDVDGDGATLASTDGLIILRRMLLPAEPNPAVITVGKNPFPLTPLTDAQIMNRVDQLFP